VKLSFRYLEYDYVRTLRVHCASCLRLRLDCLAVIVLAVVGIYLCRLPNWRWSGIVCVAISAILALILIVAFTIIPRLAFRHGPKFHDESRFTFTEEGISFRTGYLDLRLQRNIYSRAFVDVHSWVLYHGSRSFTVIPERAFQSAERRQLFEQLLTHHVPDIDRRGARLLDTQVQLSSQNHIRRRSFKCVL